MRNISLIECVMVGDVQPDKMERTRIARSLRSNPRLAERLRRARRVVDEIPVWDTEINRIKNVLLKLARGHAAYEPNEPQLEEPDIFWARPIFTMSPEEYETFEERPKPGVVELGVWPEVGRATVSLSGRPRLSRSARHAAVRILDSAFRISADFRLRGRTRPCGPSGCRVK